jgi:hypothetical protein
MIHQETDILHQTIRGFGYMSLVDFAREQAKNILQQKIAYYQSRIDFFEDRYGMSFNGFLEHFDGLQSKSILEKEDDSMRWETAIDVLAAYRNDLTALNQ